MIGFNVKNDIYVKEIPGGTNRLFLTKAYQPRISPNEQFVAFLTAKNCITVKNIKKGTEWHYKTKFGIQSFCFSPDEAVLAIMQANTQLKYKYVDGMEIIGWQFKKNQKTMIFEHINDGAWSTLDWK